MYGTILRVLLVFVTVSLLAEESAAWSGHYYSILRSYTRRYRYCASRSRWWRGCSRYRWGYSTHYYYETRCKPGWRDYNNNHVCTIPICRPSCANGGTCTLPNQCSCPSWSQGIGCRTLTCSYKRPCYPGECESNSTCTCERGFRSESIADGCTIFTDAEFQTSNGTSTLAPIIGKSNVTIAEILRDNNETKYMFTLDGTQTNFTESIWSNQRVFNFLRFEFESLFVQPTEMPERPAYVHSGQLGVVHSQIEANVSKIPRNGGRIRDPGSFKTYVCEAGFSNDSPATEVAKCEINDDQFMTRIEHGDWLTVTFQTTSGGNQKLINLDRQGAPYATKYYRGLNDVKQVRFKFDFRAPKSCAKKDTYYPSQCPVDSHSIRVDEEFTKKPIRVTWRGWQDDLSGVLEYYVEVFKLSPDPYDRLVEMDPLGPVFNDTIAHEANIRYPEYKPEMPGMFSILLETRDHGNNTRSCRSLVLFDDRSSVEVNDGLDARLYISTAVEETGFSWQTASSGKKDRFVVNWENHFVNRIHSDGKLLNEVLSYPTQFEDIEDDGLLFAKKYVDDSFDDFEGQRSRAAIENFNGIVKFEIAKEFTLSDEVPTVGWTEITPLAQTATFAASLENGARVRVWIRATDAMGNLATDSTVVRVDSTPPLVSNGSIPGAVHGIALNVDDGNYTYTSRVSFVASDVESGVHKLGFNIIVHTAGKPDRTVFANHTEANMGTSGNPLCVMVDRKCFIAQQKVELNNCWFLVNKSELQAATATVEVLAYNQALLSSSVRFNVGNITNLKGLETYSGPTNVRITSKLDRGFTVSWDLPEKPSCYGVADIVIIITRDTGDGAKTIKTLVVPGTATHADVLGLKAKTQYGLSLGLRIPGAKETQITDTPLNVQTEELASDTGVSVGLIVGIVVALIVVFAGVIVAVVILARRGVIKPGERVQKIGRAVSTRYRKSVKKTYAYDNRQSELYIYGGMDEGRQIWHLDRSDVTFEELIKSGHFANIYRAKLRTGKKSETVVAKTLKEGYTPEDEMLMKAKLNFSGTVVGNHPNCLRFIGAVVGDEAMGPFIVYEYCENGTLKDYLDQNKNNVTIAVQDNFYRFGLDIAKGMEYLAGKGVVHRRLAARNILVTFLNEVKIAGFGPQPLEEKEGDDQGKKERIPIKWMPPECMTSSKNATEKSDVWSYAVVLWEIFSLGEVPFANVRSRDLASRLKKGERLPKPEHCDDTWYDVMRKCWIYQESKRLTFKDIRNELDTMFVTSGDEFYYYQR